MGTVPVPYVPVAGDDAIQARVLTWVDAINYLLGSVTSGGSKRPLARLRQTVQTTIPTTLGAIAMDTEDVDYDNSHSTSTNTSRFTAATAGWHLVSGQLTFASNAGATAREAAWAVNGVVINGSQCGYVTNPFTATSFSLTLPAMLIYLNAGDYVEMYGQAATASVTTLVSAGFASSMSIEWRSN